MYQRIRLSSFDSLPEIIEMEWNNSAAALDQLLELLKCTHCHKLLEEACSFEPCKHYFCRACGIERVNSNLNCSICENGLWLENMKTSRQLMHTVETCHKLLKIVSKKKSINDRDTVDNSDRQKGVTEIEKKDQKGGDDD